MTDVSWPSEIPKSKIIVLFLFNGTIIDKNPLAFVRDFSLIASFFCLNRPVFVKIITFYFFIMNFLVCALMMAATTALELE
jgi:hypothetical protein